jgi:RNA polymerase sigma factor for flagellar operon FliA
VHVWKVDVDDVVSTAARRSNADGVKVVDRPVHTRAQPGTQETERLWRAWRDEGDVGARDRLILSFAPLVKYLACRKARDLPNHCDLDDLISSGLVALTTTLDRWDPTKGANLETFLSMRVSGAIVDELRRSDWTSRSIRRWERSIGQARSEWQSRHGRPPTLEELAGDIGLSRDQLREKLDALRRADVLSTNAVVAQSDNETIELGDTLVALPGEHDPEVKLLAGERIAVIRQAVESLPSRDRYILHLMYVEQLTGVEISRVLGVSESRVSQLTRAIRSRLESQIAAYETPEPTIRHAA